MPRWDEYTPRKWAIAVCFIRPLLRTHPFPCYFSFLPTTLSVSTLLLSRVESLFTASFPRLARSHSKPRLPFSHSPCVSRPATVWKHTLVSTCQPELCFYRICLWRPTGPACGSIWHRTTLAASLSIIFACTLLPCIMICNVPLAWIPKSLGFHVLSRMKPVVISLADRDL